MQCGSVVLMYVPCIGCEPGQFVCETENRRCLDMAFVCDGIPDCIGSDFPFDAFDEIQCPEGVFIQTMSSICKC